MHWGMESVIPGNSQPLTTTTTGERNMQYRQLGSAGVRVSAIGLGTNQFGGKVDQAGVNEIIDGAIDLGINLIDTADVYTGGNS
jgi:diketogulonate reductase-like aldo/keto reductase